MLNITYQNADSMKFILIFVLAILPELKYLRMKKVVFYFAVEEEDVPDLLKFCLDAPNQISDSLIVEDYAVMFSTKDCFWKSKND